jgi:DNA ligase-4
MSEANTSKSIAEIEEEEQYRLIDSNELEELYPNRPRNHGGSLMFYDLVSNLFNPLVEARTNPSRRQVTYGQTRQKLAPYEVRRSIIEHFTNRWRRDVGNDIFPLFRLILPEKDKERAMYGLKEKTIGKLLVQVMKIDSFSEDAQSVVNWKLPGHGYSASIAGDFAARAYEVLSKRPLRTEPGTMTISQVNAKLDQLSFVQKEEDQRPIFEEFYRQMNSEELKWLIRIILRQMKIGASERTVLHIWHPDAENLYSICSNLRRVCWELSDPDFRLGSEDREVSLMSCFQPQLAQFQMHSFDKMIERVLGDSGEKAFWIEEKLDGERMQLHMMEDPASPGGRKFGYWSRRAKDYTYLYGKSYEDIGALTKYLKEAFDSRVKSVILDGEMITWDAEADIILPFGTLKTAALAEAQTMEENDARPMFRVFDILYLNGESLTSFTLRDRRKALESAVRDVYRRLEIHPYEEATSAAAIEPLLRDVIQRASEGLVIKNPCSMYRLNERNDDWMKIKPEYMTEFGENLDLVVIGGYYGSGRRGGGLSSFLCGLRASDIVGPNGEESQKFYSFAKCGGGFTVQDYADIRHNTDGKWRDWNPRKPPTEYIELAGGEAQFERPDVWILPSESFVIEVKAGSVNTSDQFRLGISLRFPRFKRLRRDKSWKEGLTVKEFMDLKNTAEQEKKEKEFEIAKNRRAIVRRTKKRKLVVAGAEHGSLENIMKNSKLFDGLSFYVLSDCSYPVKKTKDDIEKMIKANGGKIVQTPNAKGKLICITEKSSFFIPLENTG